eukprot:2347950-Rhodomonas_salina.4
MQTAQPLSGFNFCLCGDQSSWDPHTMREMCCEAVVTRKRCCKTCDRDGEKGRRRGNYKLIVARMRHGEEFRGTLGAAVQARNRRTGANG